MKPRFSLIYLAIFLTLTFSLACNLSLPGTAPAIVATPTATPVPLPPTIVETVPPVGSEIPLQSPLTIYFSEAMDRPSVEAALSADFPGGFVFSWVNDAALTLAPKAVLPADASVTISLGASAKSIQGLTPLQPISLSYKTPGPLRVTQILPAAMASDVTPDSAVVVTFNQPVVPLGADANSLPAGFTLEPAAAGKGEWLNTSTYIFHAEPALAGGIKYIARVNPNLVSTTGAKLEANGQNTAWVFNTSLPLVQKVNVAETNDYLDIDSKLEIEFNQSMDTASVENAFAFNGPGGMIKGGFAWNEKSSVLTFTPSGLLDRGALYNLTIGVGARSRGGASLSSPLNANYQTVPAFGVFSTSFPTGTMHPQNTGVFFTFNAPLAKYSASDLESLVTIDPKPSYGSYYADGSVLNLSVGYEAGKSYTVTVSSRLKDQWGQQLGQDFIFNFREPDARPDLNLGTYLSALFVRPDDPVISLQAVNINSINISRGAMTTGEFLRVQSDYQYKLSYTPADRQSWQITPNLQRNDNRPLATSLSNDPLPTGLYFIEINSPEAAANNSNNRMSVVVSNINLTVKISPTEVLAWAVDLRTQAPVPNATITLFDEKANYIGSGVTDERGLWRGDLPGSFEGTGFYAIMGSPGDDQFGIGASDWASGISPYEFGLNADTSGPHPQAYLYTDRPVYRPGDTVSYRGVVRSRYDGRYNPAQPMDLTLSWFGDNGKMGDPQPVTLSDYGTFNGEYKLPENARPGYYSFTVQDGDKPLENGSISFQVADYRKPEINLTVNLGPDPAKNGQQVVATGKAEYFFGSPAADLPFSWRLYASNSYFSIPGFNTGANTSRWLSTNNGRFGSLSRNGEGRTGADGSFNIPFENIVVSDTTELTLEITTSESGGLPVSARASAIMHPDSFYIGVRPDAWVGQAGSALGFSLLTVDWDQKPVSPKLTVVFEKVRWQRDDGESEFGLYQFTPIYTQVESKTVLPAADGTASASFTPPDAGTYILDVTSGQAHTQALIWVGGSENAEWPNLPYQQLQITADRTQYTPGDTASIFIPNPFNAQTYALVTSERSTFKSVDVINVPGGGIQYKLPISEESAPNVYVSVTLLGAQGVDFRQGYINLKVDPSALTLNVDLKATPEKAKPGDNLTLDLVVTDGKGQPVQGEFSLAVVDLAALALADPNSQDIVPAYYSVQPLGVRTGLTAAIYARRVLKFPGGMGGGGGGDIITLREKFPDTAYWKADIITDAQGKARVTFKLPDSLTTWQVDTRGLTKDTKVGQARVRVVTGKELLIRPQTPRFLVVGDHAELAAMVNNTTDQPVDAVVSLQVSGFMLDDQLKPEQQVTIPANGRVRVSWRGLVQAGDVVDAVFSVKAGSLQDAARPVDGAIPVLRYSAPQTFSTSGLLNGNASRQEIIALPRSFQPLGGNLKLELSPSLASTILAALKAIESPENPWSTEQIVSTLLPNIVTYQTLKDSGIDQPELSARLQNNLGVGVRSLLNFQHPDGGWPWTMDSIHSDPYLSAYTLLVLQQVKSSEFNLNGLDLSTAIQSGRNYLITSTDELNGVADLSEPWRANRAAFYLYTLQKTGDVGSLSTVADSLYDKRTILAPWSRAMLAEVLYGNSSSDERARTLISDLEAQALRSATGAHWESAAADWMNPGTPLFTTAVVLSTLSQQDPASPLVVDVVRYLASQRNGGGRWASSYETSWVLLALNRYMKASGDLRGDFAYSATLNGAPFAQGQASGPDNMTTVNSSAPLASLNLSGANSLIINKQDGTGNLYYRADLTVDRPVESAPALDKGISIVRQFLDCANGDCQPISSYAIKPDGSGRITVKLTLTIPRDSYYLMVEDFIPAGSDILDSSLKTSQQGEQDQSVKAVYDPASPFGDGWGWWYFNRPQISADHILWSADYLPAGTYELTYTLIPSFSGQYKVLPAHAWQAYFPEVQGTTAGSIFEINP